MKAIFVLSTICLALSTAIFLFRDAGDSTILNRALRDLKEMPADYPKKRETYDAWGNPYVKATVTFGERTSSYVFSRGPDGRSETGGNDPDDIAIWTGEYGWLDSQRPNRWISIVAALVSFFVSSCAFVALVTMRRHRSAT